MVKLRLVLFIIHVICEPLLRADCRASDTHCKRKEEND